jgi:hypothetical protein
MKSSKHAVLKTCTKFFKIIDVFGINVNFKFDRRGKFKTVLGGLVTFMASLGILSFFLVLLRQIL